MAAAGIGGTGSRVPTFSSLSAMTDEPGFTIDVSDDGPVRRLVLAHPGRRNAITVPGFDRLAEELRGFEQSAARVLVVTGAGGDFSSGVDLGADQIGTSAVDNAEVMKHPAAAALALHRTTKPTVAAVDGVAYGAAMNLAIGCDVVIATERARFAQIFVRRGLTVDFGGTWLLPRLVGLARARELALTGREVGAAEALSMGLVSRVVGPGELREATDETARSLAAGAPLAQSFIKSGLSRAASLTFEQALRLEEQAQAVLLGTEDLREAVEAFFDGRDPEFRGR